MSNLLYIDNELNWTPATPLGQWDDAYLAGGQIACLPEAAWPERGGLGLRVSGGMACVWKNLPVQIQPGQELYMGLWVRLGDRPSAPANAMDLCLQNDFGILWASFPSTSQHNVCFGGDAGLNAGHGVVLCPGRWQYLVLGLQRSTDPTGRSPNGKGWVYLDGQLLRTWTNVDNYDVAASVTSLTVGQMMEDAQFSEDFDELRLSTTYPEPYAPRPTTDLLCPQRLIVLYRPASAASRQFADACVDQLGIPRANLIPLPTAGSLETLATYADFQAQVEKPIQDYFTLNPRTAQRAMAFLIGHDVPGYFMSGGVKYSAVSRLMNFGTPFVGAIENPLRALPAERPTKTTLAGKFLCARIDAADVTQSLSILSRSQAVQGLPVIPANQKLFVSDESYRVSAACGSLRLAAEPMGPLSEDALVWTDAASLPTTQSPGVQAAMTAVSAASLDSLRLGGCVGRAALLGPGAYASATGFAAAGEELDIERWFAVLRAGGSPVEAAALAVGKLDSGLVVAGNPLMTMNLPKAGYNIYHGLGDAAGIDWSAPVACTGLTDLASVKVELSPGKVHVLGARAVSANGVEESGCDVLTYVTIDAAGRLVPVLVAPTDVQAWSLAAGVTAVSFRYRVRPGLPVPDYFEILTDGGSGTIDFDHPAMTIKPLPGTQERFQVRLSQSPPLRLCVRGCIGEVKGPCGGIVAVTAGATTTPPAARSVP